jgi:hypothetical protein
VIASYQIGGEQLFFPNAKKWRINKKARRCGLFYWLLKYCQLEPFTS